MPTATQALANVIQIKVNGTDITPAIMANLKYAEVESSIHLPSMLVLKFHDPILTLIDGTTFALGAAIVVMMGKDQQSITEVFNGEVISHEPVFEETFTATFTIRAYDKLHRLNRETKRRALLQSTDSDAVSRLAREAGLTADVMATSVVHPILWQDNMTDLAFIHMLARRNGYEVRYSANKLVFKPPQSLSSGVTAIWGENLRQFEPRLSAAQQVNEVTVKGWDPKTLQPIVGVASSTTNDAQTGISATGGAAAQTAFSGAAKHLEPFVGVELQSHAQKIATAMLKDINNDYFQASGWMFGDGRLSAGKQFTLQKIGTRFSGTYRATTVTHVFQRGEFDTYFRVEGLRPNNDGTMNVSTGAQPALMEQWTGVYPAIVTNINDPDNLMRVKVKFPWLDDQLESDWAYVIFPVGFMSMPLVGSPVAVAFQQGNFNHPYVLGGMYGTAAAAQPPKNNGTAVVGSSPVQQIIKTPKGHNMLFQDKAGEEMITVTSSDSQMKIEMDITNKKITVQSAMDVMIKATGNMNLEATGNVTMKGAMVTVEATSTLDLKSTGVANLKGSMVNIN
jgi:phage protein D